MLCSSLIALMAAVAATPAAPPSTKPVVDNTEMTAIFTADQAARQVPTIDWSVVGPQDEQRRNRTKALLDEGRLHSGVDYNHAAFVFQHSGKPGDFLLAHTLAIVAVAKGHAGSAWIAAATLDRYLQNIGQPQIYGTQFFKQGADATTQEPYNRTLVSDALRAEMGVPDQKEQEKRRSDLDAGR